MKVNQFEDLICWIKARVLCKQVFSYTRRDGFSRDFELVNQIRRSSGSVMDNIAEGFDRGSNKEFIYFLFISKGSAGETRSQLYRALDQKYISEEDFKNSSELIREIQRILKGLIKSLKQRPNTGMKNWPEN